MIAEIAKAIQDRAGDAAEKAQADIAKFADEPFSRARWMDAAFDNAAVAHVFGEVVSALNHDTGEAEEEKISRIREFARDRACLHQRPQSSSTCSNLIAEAEAVAWTRAAEFLRGWH